MRNSSSRFPSPDSLRPVRGILRTSKSALSDSYVVDTGPKHCFDIHKLKDYDAGRPQSQYGRRNRDRDTYQPGSWSARGEDGFLDTSGRRQILEEWTNNAKSSLDEAVHLDVEAQRQMHAHVQENISLAPKKSTIGQFSLHGVANRFFESFR